ncbi:MAG: hypothetical protein QOK11_1953, partial [Pseudonocardiales bacterium]|nr:hypothetical protein [Pseudonocardiales bacterium]
YTLGTTGTQGLCFADFVLNNTTMTGEFVATYSDPAGAPHSIRLTDTTQMATLSANKLQQKLLVLPASPLLVQFLARTAATCTATMNVLAGGTLG